MKYILTNGRVIDPSLQIDDRLDVLVEEGRITGLQKRREKDDRTCRQRASHEWSVLDCTGKIISPGLVDVHTHLREPGLEYKETIRTGGEAALAGGFTSIACMPNTDPVNDNRAVTEFIKTKARESNLVKVYPVAAITRGSKGTHLADFGDLKDAGAVAFSDDGRPVMNAGLMRRAMEYAFSLNMPVISHCEDLTLSAGGVINEGWTGTELGLSGIPSLAEDVMVARDILIAEYTQTYVHIAHVSTKGAVSLIRQAKKRGVNVTSETAPQYFSLTDECVKEFDTNGKMNPPLRNSEDLEAVKEGLRDGTIDVIASDHAPHARTDKEVEFDYAAFGITGLETSLTLGLRLVEEKVLTLMELIEKMSCAPSRLLRIPGGTLAVGSVADLTVIDPERRWTIDPATFRSRGKNTVFSGWNVKGRAVLTMVHGKILYRHDMG